MLFFTHLLSINSISILNIDICVPKLRIKFMSRFGSKTSDKYSRKSFMSFNFVFTVRTLYPEISNENYTGYKRNKEGIIEKRILWHVSKY